MSLKLYKKEIDGKTIIKQANKIVINKGTHNVYNPKEEMILADGWVEYVKPEPTEEELLATAKRHAVDNITYYDQSPSVNEFYYGNGSFWLPRETRVSVRSTAQIMEEAGKETMELWLGDVSVTLAPKQILAMLSVLEMYALECYNTTAKHKVAVQELKTVEEVNTYDYTQGYPEKISF